MPSVGSLPKKYIPAEIEKEIKNFWKENKIYEKVKRWRQGAPKFYFLDGPPYPSSDLIHLGTAWNKTLKDAVIRYRRARGYNVRDQPGYDCHGLPIEVAVEKKLGFKTKKDIESLGVAKFVEECRRLALKNAEAMSKQFEDLGVFMDWENPYLTLMNNYVESGWWLIKKAHERGLLQKGIKVMHWCPRCQTVLADYEVSEYRMLQDPSIYVKLPLKDKPGEYLVIWTTTPWTLPANVAVMAHPDYTYVKVEAEGEVLIVAKERLPHIERETGLKLKIVEEFQGRELEGLKYRPPLLEEVPAQRELRNAHKVVLSEEYVHLEEGTGLVHAATGHGEEDYMVGLQYGLPLLVLVDEEGRFTPDAGKYAGKPARETNQEIIRDLESKGLLLHASTIVHRYPVCWRCKTPLLIRGTQQWFIRVTELKNEMLREAEQVNWIPSWAGSARYRNWLEGLRDWVISRQRYWGTPLPIWICEKCGNVEVIGSLRELAEKAPEARKLSDLHRPWVDRITFKCSKCGGTMRRVPDVIDVWFDSGISFYASLGYPKDSKEFENWMPVDFIVEGHDQFSGWFFSLMRAGLIGFSKTPYRTVLMHGFALDEKGREMHKSLGNFIAPGEVIAKAGRDALRLYVLSNTTWEDLKFSWEGVKKALSDLKIAWNVCLFAATYMSLDKYDPNKHGLNELEPNLRIEDRWLLSKLNRLIIKVTEAMDSYRIHEAARALREFVVEDLSHWYIRLIRRRAWIEGEDPDKLAAYATLYTAIKTLIVLLAPITPFITEKIYQSMIRPAEPGLPETVHMQPWPKPDEKRLDEKLERKMDAARRIVEAGLAARAVAKIKVRQPLPEAIVVTWEEHVREAAATLRDIIANQLNVKRLRLTGPEEAERFFKPEIVTPRGKVENPYRALKQLWSEGGLTLELDNEKVEYRRDQVEVNLRPVEGYSAAEFNKGVVLVKTSLTAEEILEGIARDIVRRIQQMRKELDLNVEEYIETYVQAEGLIKQAVEKHLDYLKEETRSTQILVAEPPRDAYAKEWSIGEANILIAIRRTR